MSKCTWRLPWRWQDSDPSPPAEYCSQAGTNIGNVTIDPADNLELAGVVGMWDRSEFVKRLFDDCKE
jgi:hypothetical protein